MGAQGVYLGSEEKERSTMRIIYILMCGILLLVGCGANHVPAKEEVVVEESVQAPKAEIQSPLLKDTLHTIPEFNTITLDGTEVTEEIFGNKELTVFNIWGTYCNPCIGEMPELGNWARELPENVQLVGLVIDIAGEEDTEQIELAQYIVEQTGADFTHLVVNQDFMPLLQEVVGVPTTFFIDAEGNILGEAIVGANPEGYKQRVDEYVEAME